MLVGGFNPLKNMKVNWDDYFQYMEKKNVPSHQSEWDFEWHSFCDLEMGFIM